MTGTVTSAVCVEVTVVELWPLPLPPLALTTEVVEVSVQRVVVVVVVVLFWTTTEEV